MRTIRHATALLALLAAAGIAQAQESTAPAPQAPAAQSADCPAPGSVPEAQLPENCKTAAQTGTNQDAQTNPDGTTTPPSTTTAGQVPADMDLKSAFLASNFIGQTVYSAADENVGEINDLIMSKDKGALVAILGVGGFLGIGEKDVAIPIEQIGVSKTDGNTLRLTINSTREQLEAAPAFDRTALYVAPGAPANQTNQ